MTSAGMRDAATALHGSVDDEQRTELCLPLADEDERTTWFYWPSARAGLSLGRMTADQRTVAHRLLATGLSLPAYAKAAQIIALERVLGEIEGHAFPRDPAYYFVTLFGDPSEPRWGWRFEGHHVSVHVTVSGDDVRCLPSFLGANPAVVRSGDAVVSRPLAEEEDAGRALLLALDDAGRARAVVSDEAPDDILTSNLPVVGDLPDEGLPVAEMVRDARAAVDRLLDAYVSRAPDGLAAAERARIDADSLVFAWAGSPEPGERHYYRLLGPTLVIEYDNTQNDANHVHAVWRDRERDFGRDLLREHLVRHHGG